MSATEATVAAPVEEVKVVETPAPEPAPVTEAPAAEQPAPAPEAAPAAVHFFILLSDNVSQIFFFTGGTQGRRTQSRGECCPWNRDRVEIDTFSFRNPLLRLPLTRLQSLLLRLPLLSPSRKKPRP